MSRTHTTNTTSQTDRAEDERETGGVTTGGEKQGLNKEGTTNG